MTTRRTVLTGLAALPMAGQISTVEASAPTPAPPEETSTAKPVFIHDIDRQLFDELKVLQAALTRVLDRLRVANNPNPMIRSGALFDMRCSFQTLSMTERELVDALGAMLCHATNVIGFNALIDADGVAKRPIALIEYECHAAASGYALAPQVHALTERLKAEGLDW